MPKSLCWPGARHHDRRNHRRHRPGSSSATAVVSIAQHGTTSVLRQLAYEVRGGKIVGMLKDVAYQSRTPEFWNSMDMIGGQRSYWLGGSFGDGKGEPSQSNSVSHGCPPARFQNVNIVNTGRTA